uniref:Uncharacterized protein n=1 Tax=Romanomermis culicivorax TaxID=13658 RepID=A0A915IBE0_ROMCU
MVSFGQKGRTSAIIQLPPPSGLFILFSQRRERSIKVIQSLPTVVTNVPEKKNDCPNPQFPAITELFLEKRSPLSVACDTLAIKCSKSRSNEYKNINIRTKIQISKTLFILSMDG